MFEIIKNVIILFLCISTLSFLGCKNSALGGIEETGIIHSLYPQHYIPPTKWMRKWFKVRQTRIPKFFYAELVLSVIFAAMGPINILLSVLVLGMGWEKRIIGVLTMIHVGLIILNAIVYAIMETLYKKKDKNEQSKKM